jgi:Kelch motif
MFRKSGAIAGAALAAITALGVLSRAADADTLAVSADGQTRSAPAHSLCGGVQVIQVANHGRGGEYRGYFRFDLSPLPDGATIDKAVLRLFASDVDRGGTILVVPILEPWNEKTLTAETAPILGAPVASFGVARADRGHFLSVEITGLVRDWLRGIEANNGLALLGADDAPVVARFDSKENVLTSHAPEVEAALAGAGGDGPPGPPGPAGTAATVQVGMTTTLPPGSPAAVANTGTPEAAILSFFLPKGDTGDPGAGGALPSGAFIVGTPGDTNLVGAGFSDTGLVASGISGWVATSATGAPSGRSGQTVIWAGTRMIVWGGIDGSAYLNSGGQYDPATDNWTPMNTTGAPTGRWLHTAVWTGSRMIVWGGLDTAELGDGAAYDPVADSWTPLSPAGSPSPRWGHSAVWTGTHMIVWGGEHAGQYLGDGGQYDPGANTWTSTGTAPPSPRANHTAVWAGTRMIVWGGYDGTSGLDDGGQYDPAAMTWTPISTAGAPSERSLHTAIWTGSRMIVWGGYDGSSALGTGGRYDPVTDNWTPTSPAGAPGARYLHTAVWTGGRMVLWGGYNRVNPLDTGGQYDPAADSWIPTSTAGAPEARSRHTAVWTGARMVVWGGLGTGSLSSGAQLLELHFFRKN